MLLSVHRTGRRYLDLDQADGLQQSRFQPRSLGHHAGVPRRIEGKLDVDLCNPRNDAQLGAHVLHQNLAHAAPRGGQRHHDKDVVTAIRVRRDVQRVDQAKINNVDGDFRVVAGR